MSDPVTNVEIEDVLSSIRRLVSDGDKARTRDPAPVEPEEDMSVAGAEETVAPTESSARARPEKLILSPAFMVVDNETDDQASDDEGASDGSEHDPQDSTAEGDATEIETLILPDPIEPDEGLPAQEAEVDVTVEDAATSEPSDRSSLVATIAELEAAVSGSSDDYEPDGSEVSNETIAWPGATLRNLDDVEDAEMEGDAPESSQEQTSQDALADGPGDAQKEEPVEQTEQTHNGPTAKPEPDVEAEAMTDRPEVDVYEDDDLDDLLDDGGVSIDEEALREMVASVVREELTGPLGERITRNVRKLVRREIYRILSSQEFD